MSLSYLAFHAFRTEQESIDNGSLSGSIKHVCLIIS